MYQKDYILRMIEMLGDLVAAVFGLARKGDFQQATEKLERIYYDMLRRMPLSSGQYPKRI
jgi:predicted translin family RNA/ssDNA-binding protein